jgi:calcium/calmodulin-dependent protein kinase (CaM kinase) II/calcium/calmodulin-dependent protein kinase I
MADMVCTFSDPPFIEQNQRELFRKIRKGQYEFHEEYWGAVSKDAKNLIASLLTVDPAKRLSAKEALSHKWLLADGKKLAAQDLGKNLDEFKKYNARRKFKGAVKAVSVLSEFLDCLYQRLTFNARIIGHRSSWQTSFPLLELTLKPIWKMIRFVDVLWSLTYLRSS